MNIETVRRLNLARHLYELGATGLRSANDLHLFSSVNLFQDSVESFLVAIADHLGAEIDQNTRFDKYFVAINDKLNQISEGKVLPFKMELLRLNRIRVDSKHYGIQPDREECKRLAISVREFFNQVCSDILGANFSTISVIDLLADGDTKDTLRLAADDLKNGRLEDCVINCRKAIYLEIERKYDISEYKDGKPRGLLAGFSMAPYFAKSKDYVEKNVRDPTDFIVYDHSGLNQYLLTRGVDNTTYWNIWRLTPSVYQDKQNNWYVKHDFKKLNRDVLVDNTEYIFSATMDVVLSLHTSAQAARWNEGGKYYLELAREHVSIYEKASRNSPVAETTYPGMTRIDTDYRVEGLDGDGLYWHVAHFEKDRPWLWGYIYSDDVK